MCRPTSIHHHPGLGGGAKTNSTQSSRGWPKNFPCHGRVQTRRKVKRIKKGGPNSKGRVELKSSSKPDFGLESNLTCNLFCQLEIKRNDNCLV